MSAETVDLSLTQGSLFSISLTLKDAAGNPRDLTNYGVRGYIKNRYSDTTALVSLTPTITNAVGGVISISILPSITETLPVTEAVYDIEKYLLSDAEDTEKVLQGKASINPEATI